MCEFQTHPQKLPLWDPSGPHRWTFEKQTLESVLSNGFIKEAIILQQGGAVNGRLNDVFHYPTLTKLFIQGLTEYLQFIFFQRGKELFPLSPLPPSVSTEDLCALIKSEFSQLSSTVSLSPLCLNRHKRGIAKGFWKCLAGEEEEGWGQNRKCLGM